MTVPILLDCDPGHDDAVALLLAAGHDAIDILAISTVAGNCTARPGHPQRARRRRRSPGSTASRSPRARPGRCGASS